MAIYYEALCPDSINFIQNQLIPQYPYFADAVNLQFVPFGKSSVNVFLFTAALRLFSKLNDFEYFLFSMFQSWQRGSQIGFRCQHGPDECEGNKIQSCVLNSITIQKTQLQFVGCQMQRGVDPTGQAVS